MGGLHERLWPRGRSVLDPSGALVRRPGERQGLPELGRDDDPGRDPARDGPAVPTSEAGHTATLEEVAGLAMTPPHKWGGVDLSFSPLTLTLSPEGERGTDFSPPPPPPPPPTGGGEQKKKTQLYARALWLSKHRL